MTSDVTTRNRGKSPLPSSSVHPQETTPDSPLPYSYRKYLESFETSDLAAASETIRYLFPDPADPIPKNFAACRSSAWFVREKTTGEVRVHARSCKNRFCPFCSRSKAYFISHNVHQWVKTLDRPKLLTLTLQHSSAPLGDQIGSLYRHFRNWRNRSPMKTTIRGGVWFVQVTLNAETYTWHPHLHIILDADYVPQKVLADKWLKVTKTSSVLDIRQIRSPEKAADYVARYVARPGKISDMPVDYRAEIYTTFGGLRSCGCFGTARVAKITTKTPFDATQWETIGSWGVVVTIAPFNKPASQILSAWKLRKPLPSNISVAEIDRQIDWDIGELDVPKSHQEKFEYPL